MMEGAGYDITLNLIREQVRASTLLSSTPCIRSNKESKPGIRGARPHRRGTGKKNNQSSEQ